MVDLFKVGTGWFGWSAEQTLATPMPQIELAREGRIDMLRIIFGGKGKTAVTIPASNASGVGALLRGMSRKG